MSLTEVHRVALLIADDAASACASRIVDALRSGRDRVQIVTHRIGALALAAHGAVLPDRALQAAASADAVLVAIGAQHRGTAAALASICEQLGFTRGVEGDAARMWLNAAGTRGCFLVDALPSGFAAVALALEHAFGDRDGANALRAAQYRASFA